MRTLVVTRKPIYPPIGGAPLRNWQNVSALQSFGEVATFSILSRLDPEKIDTPPGVRHCKYFHGKVIANKRQLSYKIAKRFWWLRPRGHWYADDYYAGWVARELEAAIADFQPDVIVLEELMLHQYFRVLAQSGAVLIYDAHNAEFLLDQQIHQGVGTFRERLTASIQTQKTKAIEQFLLQRVDQIWACSEQDASLLRQLYSPKAPIQVIPNGIDTDFYRDVREGNLALPEGISADDFNLLFVATFNYKPNSRAAEVLIQDVFPKVQAEYPNCRLLLVGNAPTKFMRQAGRENDRIVVTGRVPDVRPYLAAATLSVMPLQEGSGTRLKILEAFACKCPVVTTAKGIEGIDAVPNRDFILAEETAIFIKEINELLRDMRCREKLAHCAYEFVLENYSWRALRENKYSFIGSSQLLMKRHL